MRILIAEDNLVNQLLLRMYMKKLGWEYSIVENGLQAMETCRTEDFHAILMDINMPELNGMEATRYIRMFNDQIPIIGLTACLEDFTSSKCAKAGMNALIEKPVSLNSIREIITELVALNGLRIA